MEEEEKYCQNVAGEILRQIIHGIGVNAFYSWGCSRKMYAEIDGRPALVLQVNGFLFCGLVAVVYDDDDTYSVRTAESPADGWKIVRTQVYCDEIGRVLDELIEKPAEQTDEEYHAKALAYLATM